jgi:hypothetical protein
MNIDISPEIEARLKARALTDGVSVGAYVERLVSEEDTRRIRLAEFAEAIDERMESLNRGETVDGEEVMGRLIDELDRDQRGFNAR